VKVRSGIHARVFLGGIRIFDRMRKDFVVVEAAPHLNLQFSNDDANRL
jgi:hypothetical protein